MRMRFIMSEMGIGLRRNLSMTIALVLTVAISLGLLAVALLMSRQISTMKDYWFDKIQVSVFLSKDVTEAERNAILSELHSLPQVQQVYYESQQQAYERAQQLFKGNTALLRNIQPNTLPESYRVKLYDPRQYLVVSSAVQNMPGVDEVQGRSQALENFFRLLSYAQKFGLGIAVVALVAAVLLIFNTVRLAAFSRRRETGIMRLVGASDLYIQGPFILEGVVAGLIGALLAVLGLAVVKMVLIDKGVHAMFGSVVRYVGWGAVWSIAPVLLITGIVLAAITSFATLQRYLRV